MSNHNIITIGGSTGALAALKRIFAALPAALPAAVFVVRHVAADSLDTLAEILDNAGPLAVKTAAEGDVIENGRAYVAPAGLHLMMNDKTIQLGHGPRENRVRPAIDPLFRSAAIHHGPRVIAVVLSGFLDDGAAGLAAVKRCGGLTIVQDPADAEAAEMPLGALKSCDIDYRAPAHRLGELLARLAGEKPGPGYPVPKDIALEVQIAAGRPSTTSLLATIATPVALSCPDCGGVLSEIGEHSSLRYRCQIGHAYSALVLDGQKKVALAEAVGVALRVLEERWNLVSRMAEDARQRDQDRIAKDYEEKAAELRRQADALRKAIADDDIL